MVSKVNSHHYKNKSAHFTKDSSNDPEKDDTNNDGELTIDDVTKLVNLLLKKAE